PSTPTRSGLVHLRSEQIFAPSGDNKQAGDVRVVIGRVHAPKAVMPRKSGSHDLMWREPVGRTVAGNCRVLVVRRCHEQIELSAIQPPVKVGSNHSVLEEDEPPPRPSDLDQA